MSIFELVTGGNITANDPGFPEHPPTTPDQFSQDTDPSRFTIWIPTDHVTVNMGNPVFTASGSAENLAGVVQVDGGFVAQTDAHVHLHTFGAAVGTPETRPGRTVVRLGTPVTVVAAVDEGYASDSIKSHTSPDHPNLPLLANTTGNIESTDIGSVYPPPYNDWDGYAMLTEGAAYQESQENHLIVSGQADLRLGGQRTVLVGTPGQVHIMADSAQSLVSIVRNEETDAEADTRIDGTGKWVGSLRAETLFDAAMTTVAAGLALAAAIDLVYRIQFARSPTPDKVGWEAPGFGDWAGLVLQLAGVGGGLVAAGLAIKPLPPGGDVTVYASGSYKAVGTFSTSMHGGVMTSVSGGALNLVSAGAIMSVSSLLISSFSGTFTAVSGLLSVGVSSEWGTVKVNGRKSSELSSHGKVFVAGRDAVQVNATDGCVSLHGRKGFYVGCGGGPSTPSGLSAETYPNEVGFGILATPTLGGNPGGQMRIGRMNQGNDFVTPTPDTDVLITMNNTKVLLQHYKATIALQREDIVIGDQIGSGKVHIG